MRYHGDEQRIHELEGALRAAKEALRRVDAFLTVVQGDAVPRGEACKMQARTVARAALAAASTEPREHPAVVLLRRFLQWDALTALPDPLPAPFGDLPYWVAEFRRAAASTDKRGCEYHALYVEGCRNCAAASTEGADGKVAQLRAALEAVLADDGNCTADEPQDSACPRCQARKLLGQL